MKGIIKGSLFSLILLTVIILGVTAVRLFFEVDEKIIRVILWSFICLSIFAGAFPVSKASNNKKAVKGIISSLLSLVIIIISIIFLGDKQLSGSVYALGLLCILSGVLGAFTGSR